MYEYAIKEITKVVDGDTIDIECDLGFKIDVEIRLRLEGINAPEKRGKTKKAGMKAKEFVEKWLELHEELMATRELLVKTSKKGKYGRWIGDIYYKEAKDGLVIRRLTDALLESKNAKGASY